MTAFNTEQIDFAISYAGENEEVAKEIAKRIGEMGFSVFLASEKTHLLIGQDGETFFENLFSKAREVIVLISKEYKEKIWTRFEWDVILERDPDRRFIPIKLNQTKILGLPSNIIHVRFKGDNYSEIVDICIKRLLINEKNAGIKRPSEFDHILRVLREESEGAVDKAYQLILDERKRMPLEDYKLLENKYIPSYKEIEGKWYNYSMIKRRSVKIVVQNGLKKDELIFNLKHCAITQFNTYKPDAIMVFGYLENTDIDGIFTAGRLVFAPYGKWEKAEEGYTYNLPLKVFQFEIQLS